MEPLKSLTCSVSTASESSFQPGRDQAPAQAGMPHVHSGKLHAHAGFGRAARPCNMCVDCDIAVKRKRWEFGLPQLHIEVPGRTGEANVGLDPVLFPLSEWSLQPAAEGPRCAQEANRE